MDNEKIVRCLCGRLYYMYSMYVGDQSQCDKCRLKLQQEFKEQFNENRSR